jgi:hypothetical protein
MQGDLPQQCRDAAPAFAGQPLPNRRRQIAHREIQANAPTRSALETRFSVIRRNPSNYERHCQWGIELFFKWIKQYLRIKQFYGTSENTVKTQVWIAVSVCVLVAIVKKRLALDASLHTLLHIFSIALFEKMPINQALAFNEIRSDNPRVNNQLNLFDF